MGTRWQEGIIIPACRCPLITANYIMLASMEALAALSSAWLRACLLVATVFHMIT